MSTHEEQIARDATDLERFGYKQELKRDLGTFSSFAVAFSYISPSTGIFTLFFLGMSALGGFLFWTWPVVAGMQLIVALNFAELSSHFPVAGSVYQWTKYLANRGYAWITGWFYLFAGILTVASVCATLPIALLPMLNNMFDWNLNTELGSADQRIAALVTLALITILNIYGVKVVAVVNTTSPATSALCTPRTPTNSTGSRSGTANVSAHTPWRGSSTSWKPGMAGRCSRTASRI